MPTIRYPLFAWSGEWYRLATVSRPELTWVEFSGAPTQHTYGLTNHRTSDPSGSWSPKTCPGEWIPDHSGGLGNSGQDGPDTEKPREIQDFAGSDQWALRDSNPRPSRCKRDALAN